LSGGPGRRAFLRTPKINARKNVGGPESHEGERAGKRRERSDQGARPVEGPDAIDGTEGWERANGKKKRRGRLKEKISVEVTKPIADKGGKRKGGGRKE